MTRVPIARGVADQGLGFARESDSLGVGKAFGFAAELLEQHAILFLEIIDDVLLMPVHRTGHNDEQ